MVHLPTDFSFLLSAFCFSELSSNPSSEGPVVRGPVVSSPRSLVPGPLSMSLGPRSAVCSPWSVVFPLAAFSILWLDLIRQLSYTWETNEQYAYGWFVPIFALGLFLKKWPSRPGSEVRSQKSEVGGQWSVVSSPPFLLSAFSFLLLLLLLPVRLVHEINADWPLVNRLHLLIVLSLSLYAVFLMGGWRWVKHFAFPICFIVVAVRWPSRIEMPLTQGMMQLAASITVEVLGWLDIPAMQRGNLIDLATGTVGVDEACSGIRSFQSTFMAALFLGELYLLSWPRRLLLVPAGLVLAFSLNVVRTSFLTFQASKAGLEAIHKWHDPAGFTIFFVTFGCLWLLALVLNRSNPKARTPEPPVNPQLPTDHGTTGLQTTDQGPRTEDYKSTDSQSDSALKASDFNFQLSAFSFQPCRRFMLAVGLWTICVLVFTELWYRAHDKDDGWVRWSVMFPEAKPAFQKLEVPPRAREILKYDLGATAKWQEDEGAEWTAYFLRWEGKSMQAMMPARFHRPEVCLAGAGLRQVSESTLEYFDAGHLKLPFRKYTFSGQGQTLYVFFCLWQDGDESRKGMRWYGLEDRVFMAIEGRRRYGLQSLEIITSRYSDLGAAEQAVRQRLPSLIQIGAQ